MERESRRTGDMKKISCFAILAASMFLMNFQPSVALAGEDKTSVNVTQQQDAGADAKQAAAEQEKLKKNAEEAKKIIIARVNGEGISMYDLVRMMNRIVPRYVGNEESVTPEITEKVKKEALDELIFQELAIQEAAKQGVKIEQAEIDKVVANVKKNIGGDKAYAAYLENIGLTEETFRKQIERGHQYELITKREIYGKVTVDSEKIKAEYEKIRKEGKLHMGDNYVVKDVLLMGGADEAATGKRAESLLAEIKKNGYDFGKLVLDGTFITRRIKVDKDAHPAIYKAMAKMKVGDTSGVIKDKDNYHIVQVVSKEPARDQTLEEARGFIENRLRVPAQDERRAQWANEMRQNAKIEIMLEQIEKELKNRADMSAMQNQG